MTVASRRASQLKDKLCLASHAEGGWFRRVHPPQTAGEAHEERAALSAIHYLLQAGEASAWHRIDAVEAWHYLEGAPVELVIYDADTERVTRHVVGPLDAEADARPLHMVSARAWQAARSLGAYSLVTCLVVPEFVYGGFELLHDGPLADRMASALAQAGIAPIAWPPGREA